MLGIRAGGYVTNVLTTKITGHVTRNMYALKVPKILLEKSLKYDRALKVDTVY